MSALTIFSLNPEDEKDAILSVFIYALLEYSFCGREGDQASNAFQSFSGGDAVFVREV